MIILISGEPGAGKTSYAVNMLLTDPLYQNRPLFVMGIPDLKISHIPVPPIHQWTKSVPTPEDASISTDVFDFPDGALLVVDEAQKILRPRPSGSRPPSYVTAFETHRHLGLDFILITQSPSLIDAHVRKLVGRHIHVTGNWAGGKLYESSSAFDPLDRSALSAAVVRKYSIPKQSFGFYRSASLHTKIRRRLPLSFYVVIAVLILAPILIFYAYKRISSYLEPVAIVKPPSSVGSSEKAVTVPPAPIGNPERYVSGTPLVEISSKSFIPRMAGRPETAPLYDSIRQVANLPIVKGCISGRGKCVCYTDQGTDTFLSLEQCKNWLEHRPYNPWGTNRVSQDEKPDRT